MSDDNSGRMIYILGSGAIGFPLAAFLARAGRAVLAVRTSRHDVEKATVHITVNSGIGGSGDGRIQASVETVSLSRLREIDGIIVVAAKSYANVAIAEALRSRSARGPIIVMQNGVGVEKPFLDAGFPTVYRCVLYVTSQTISDYEFSTRPIKPAPIGVVSGEGSGLAACVEALSTESLPFRTEAYIQREVWKKAIINAVFNSVCPLLDTDNGIFTRDQAAKSLAEEIIAECLELTGRLGLDLRHDELMNQLLTISEGSSGQLISTLQDIRAGRPTEIEYLNLGIAKIAANLHPALILPRTEILGKMILAKSTLGKR